MAREVVVVGICGASGSGKSALARGLAEDFESPLQAINADSYFKPQAKKPPCLHGKSRCSELPESVDLPRLARDLARLVEELRSARVMPSVTLQGRCLDTSRCGEVLGGGSVMVVVEGFVLFAEPAILQLCDHRVWLDCDEETGRGRRFQRKQAKSGKPIDEGEFRRLYEHVFWHHCELRAGFLEAARRGSCLEIDARQPMALVRQSAVEVLRAALARPKTPVEPALELEEAAADVAASPAPTRQRRWGRQVPASTPPAVDEVVKGVLQECQQLLGRRVLLRWRDADGEHMTEGVLRSAQGRSSVKLFTDTGDVLLVRATSVLEVGSLHAESTPVVAALAAVDDALMPLQGSVLEVAPDAESAAAPAAATPAAQGTCARNCAAPYVFDMETGDPDDVITLLFLAAHPSVHLRAVTITPGSEEQVSLVRWLLQQVGLTDVRLGAQDWHTNARKPGCMKGHFYSSFGRSAQGEPAVEPAERVLLECCSESVTLVTGAPLHNLGAALGLEGFRLGRWVAQGGFAGEGVVPRELQLVKFAGKVACPTWNFNGNVTAATAALASRAIGRKVLVSKNVCHRAVYDERWHSALGRAVQLTGETPVRGVALRLINGAMDAYLRRKPDGKKLHDPLALAVALDEDVCRLAEVEVFRERGGWGSRLSPGSGVWISVEYDPERFRDTLLRD